MYTHLFLLDRKFLGKLYNNCLRNVKHHFYLQCYDLLGEGSLRRETMYQLMKKSLAKASRDDDVEEAVKVRHNFCDYVF